MSAKDRAMELYALHIALAENCTDNGRLFRKTVMEQLMAETGCTTAAAATHYNTAKKATPVDGVGRAAVPKGVRKASGKAKAVVEQPDNECFAVIELLPNGTEHSVGRCQTFLMQGDASEKFDEKVELWPRSNWVMIQGLGPNHGETFKLDPDEKEIKRYSPPVIDDAAAKLAAYFAEADKDEVGEEHTKEHGHMA